MPSTSITPVIRPATEADIDAIVALINLAFLSESFCVTGDRTHHDDIKNRMGIGRFYVIDDIDHPARLAGSVFASVENGRGYLGLLAVQPEAQGRGLSHLLMETVETHCREAGCRFLDITVVNVRANLFPFYEKAGFTACDVLPFPVPERMRMPLHLVKMTKPLVAPTAPMP